jgi:hypothetical protein
MMMNYQDRERVSVSLDRSLLEAIDGIREEWGLILSNAYCVMYLFLALFKIAPLPLIESKVLHNARFQIGSSI